MWRKLAAMNKTKAIILAGALASAFTVQAVPLWEKTFELGGSSSGPFQLYAMDDLGEVIAATPEYPFALAAGKTFYFTATESSYTFDGSEEFIVEVTNGIPNWVMAVWGGAQGLGDVPFEFAGLGLSYFALEVHDQWLSTTPNPYPIFSVTLTANTGDIPVNTPEAGVTGALMLAGLAGLVSVRKFHS